MEHSDTPPANKPWRLGAAHRAGRTVIGRSITPPSPVPDGRRESTGAGPTQQRDDRR